MQATVGTPVTDPQPGDLMANAGHAGIYIGNGLMIHAMNPVDGTKGTAVMPGMGYYRLLGEGRLYCVERVGARFPVLCPNDARRPFFVTGCCWRTGFAYCLMFLV